MSLAPAPHGILGAKYRLIRPLDKGGMGSVWLGEHLALASPVAIKLITANVAKTAERLQRFLREARAAAAARSPHVVQILDYGVHDGTPFIVMELLEGESLADRLQRRGQLGPSETEAIVRHVSRALTRAHEAGIVHRDLKPANIFITHNEEEEIIKVFDFGIAKAAEALLGSGMAKATRTGSLLGTPYYMSPEQLEGGRRSDHRTDIWALGVIAFECLLGRLPFKGHGIGGLVLAICSEPPPIPSQHGEVPQGFDAWFARACCRDLEQRFASAREAAASLRAAVGGSSVELRGGSVEPGPGAGGEASVELPSAVASSAQTLASAAPPPITADPSTATLDREGRARPRAMVWAAPIVACAAIALALQGFRRASIGTDGAPGDATVEPVQPLAAAAVTAGLIVLGDGDELRASVDGQDIGPVPCEVEGVAAGDHTVVLSGTARYRPSHHRVHLEPGSVVTIGPVKLEVAKGLARIVGGEGTEGAELSLSVGDSTLRVPELPVELDVETAQPHVLHAEKPGFVPYHQPIRFDDGEAEKTFSVELVPLPDEPPAKTKPAAKKATKSKGHRPSSRNGRARSTVLARARARAEADRPDAVGANGRGEASRVAAKATFTFTATPPSSVLLDGEPLGSTPIHDMPVAAGSHRVIFIHGAQRKAMLVVGVSGKSKMVSASFRSTRDD